MTALDYPIGLAEAWAEHLARQKARHPNAALKGMFDREAGIEDLLSEMNKVFAVVKYGHGTTRLRTWSTAERCYRMF